MFRQMNASKDFNYKYIYRHPRQQKFKNTEW